MDSDIKEKIYCNDDGEYRIYCHVSDKLAVDRYDNNHLKPKTHINTFILHDANHKIQMLPHLILD